MGAAAFVMAEFLEVPYTTIVIAAIVPAAMHYLGVLSIVHFEAKRLGLKGMPAEEIPKILDVLRTGWPTAIPLVVLIYVLFSGYSPNMAAFWGITTALVVGFLNPMHRIGFATWPRPPYSASSTRWRSVRCAQPSASWSASSIRRGLASGSASSWPTAPRRWRRWCIRWSPGCRSPTFTVPNVTLLVSLVLIAITCILMGAGLPTTALYIMLATVAQPALGALGVPPLASHLFVLYYGVISEITPPVCASAYAAAGIAGANPFRTGVSAFTLGHRQADGADGLRLFTGDADRDPGILYVGCLSVDRRSHARSACCCWP